MPYTVIRLPFGKYIYERNVNDIIALPVGITTEKIDEYLNRIGIVSDNFLEEICHPSSHFIEQELRGCVFNLVLQVTQNCNLRCSYCAYSGAYYNRTHSQKRMSFDMAKKAIDFLFSHSSERDQLVIGFYGGEPLLEFELITQIVEYSESIGWGKKLRYVVTTNATLLTDKVLDFFIRYNFDVMISFDGPKEVHDKNRRFTNGQGSFDLIMDNLENARRRYPDFYKKIMTNTVLSPEEDYGCVKRFFDADSLVSELNSRLSLISEEDIKEKITYGEALTISQQEELTKIYLHLLKKIDSDNISKLYLPLEEFIIKTYFDLKQEGNQQYKIDHPGGPCVPGKRRVFVDINGLLYPCEKISECREASIGSLEEGFDFSAINRLINIGKLTEKACKSCWAFVFCNQCANSAFDHGKLSASARLARCQSVKAVALNSLRTVIMLEHYGFDFERWNANNENRDIWSE